MSLCFDDVPNGSEIMYLGSEIDNELQKREQLIREYERRQVRKKFNIVSLSIEYPYSNWKPNKHCPYHAGVRLIPTYDENGVYEPGKLTCPNMDVPFHLNQMLQLLKE